MTKIEFINALQKKLSGLPKKEVDERISFYSEMIDDRTEDGYTEEQAVLSIGTADEIAAQILSDIPFIRIAKERIKPKRSLEAWEIVLLIIGSPLWLSLGIALLSVIISIYATLWAVILSLWATFVSFVAGAVGGVIAGIVLAICGNGLTGLMILGAGIMCAGLSIFTYFGCITATKGAVVLAKKITIAIKRCFIRKGETA